MKRLKVCYRPTALADLKSIFHFVHDISGSARVARRFTRRIQDRCDRIGLLPFGGPLRDDLAQGLRLVPFEHSAVIAYVIERDRVLVTNIFYGGRDYEALFRRHRLEDEG